MLVNELRSFYFQTTRELEEVEPVVGREQR
jgi:hypothetical protein